MQIHHITWTLTYVVNELYNIYDNETFELCNRSQYIVYLLAALIV